MKCVIKYFHILLIVCCITLKDLISLTACVMFNFTDFETVKKVVSLLPPVGIGTGYGLPQERLIVFSFIFRVLI